MVPIEPFRQWLLEMIARSGSPEAAEGSVGMDSRKLRSYAFPTAPKDVARKTVSLEVVDAALQHEGGTFLWELYPDQGLYPKDF